MAHGSWDQRVAIYLWRGRFVVVTVAWHPVDRLPRYVADFQVLPDTSDEVFRSLAALVIEGLNAGAMSRVLERTEMPPFLAELGFKQKIVAFQRASRHFSVTRDQTGVDVFALKEFRGERGWRRDPARQIRLSLNPGIEPLSAALRSVLRAESE